MLNNELQNNISQFEIESLARLLLPQMQEWFESEDNRLEFEEYLQNGKA